MNEVDVFVLQLDVLQIDGVGRLNTFPARPIQLVIWHFICFSNLVCHFFLTVICIFSLSRGGADGESVKLSEAVLGEGTDAPDAVWSAGVGAPLETTARPKPPCECFTLRHIIEKTYIGEVIPS